MTKILTSVEKAAIIREMTEKKHTAKEIGTLLGISPQRVFQIQRKFGIQSAFYKRKSEMMGLTPAQHWFDKMLRIRIPEFKKALRMELIKKCDLPTHCPILGVELDYEGKVSRGQYSRRSDDHPMLVKVCLAQDSWEDNLMVISGRANQIRNLATPQELREVADFTICCMGGIVDWENLNES